MQEDVHAFRGHAVILVVDAGTRLRRNEGRCQWVTPPHGTLGHPHNVLRKDVLIRSEVQEFIVSEMVDDSIFGVWLGGDEVEQRIREGFHHSVVASVRVCQHGGLGSTLRDVLVLELLGEGQVEGFVVQAFAFASMDFFGPRPNDSEATPRDIAEAHVEAREVSSPDEEHAEGQRGPIFMVQVRRVNSEGQPVTFVEEDVRAPNGQYGVQHGLDGNPSVLEIDPFHFLTHIGQPQGEVGLGKWVVGVEASQQEVGDLLTKIDVFAGPSTQANPAVCPTVDFDQLLVGQFDNRIQHFCVSLAKSGVGVRQLEGGGVDPFVPLQVSANDTPKRAVFNEDTLFALNDETKQSDLAVVTVVDAVEIRPENIDAIHGQPFGHALQHPAGRGVHHGHHDAAVSLVFLLLEPHNRTFGPR